MFRNPFSIDGRIRRSEYAVSLSIFVIAFVGVIVMDASSGGDSGHSILILFLSPLLWFIFSQEQKGVTILVVVGRGNYLFFLLWLIIEDGQDGANEYGKNLKGIENQNQKNVLDLNNSADEEPSLIISKEGTEKIRETRGCIGTDGFGKMEEKGKPSPCN